MFRVTRNEAQTVLDVSRRNVTLSSRTWTVTATGPWLGAVASYQRPQSVEDGIRRRIVDHLMLARLVGLAAVAIALLSRRMGR